MNTLLGDVNAQRRVSLPSINKLHAYVQLIANLSVVNDSFRFVRGWRFELKLFIAFRIEFIVSHDRKRTLKGCTSNEHLEDVSVSELEQILSLIFQDKPWEAENICKLTHAGTGTFAPNDCQFMPLFKTVTLIYIKNCRMPWGNSFSSRRDADYCCYSFGYRL